MPLTSREKVVRGYRLILEGLGYDWKKNPHMKDTPERAARAMLYELCAGLTQVAPKMTTFPLKGDSNMVISRGIPVKSLCAHHLLPFIGEATVAYIPAGKLLGLSKLSRAVDYLARKPQVQEELTNDVAEFLVETLGLRGGGGGGVGVVIRARHDCMELRGVQHPSDVITSALRGVFNEAEVRAEFLSLAGIS